MWTPEYHPPYTVCVRAGGLKLVGVDGEGVRHTFTFREKKGVEMRVSPFVVLAS